ncbi:hypothetical protein [Haloprofundus marisrubri]|nr:hypothetical protein [Haloprofundus marisrubri]
MQFGFSIRGGDIEVTDSQQHRLFVSGALGLTVLGVLGMVALSLPFVL